MGKKSFFATLFLILLLIFFLFPQSTGKEHFLVPERIINLDKTSSDAYSDELGQVSFALDNYFGYFTDELEVTYLEEKKYNVTISDSTFINYPKIPEILDVQNMKGEGRSIIETTGYPVIQGDRIAILSDSFISLYDLDGHLYWKKEILSIVTSLAITDDHVLIGYLDGYCELISMSGYTEFSFRPGGSRIEAVYSAAISSDGQYITVISGLDPQRLILLQNRKGEYKPVFHKELENEYRRSINMYFSQDNTMVFFENFEGVNLFDVNTKKVTNVGDSGNLKKIYKDVNRNLYSLLLSDNTGGILKILTPENKILLHKQFNGKTLLFKKRDDRYYIGSDNLLMYLKLVIR